MNSEIKFKAYIPENSAGSRMVDVTPEAYAKWFNVYKFLRYTGLKDKNDQEIYEGYIVEYYVKDTAVGRFRVKLDEGGCWDYGIGLEHSEIIGNIYENPDLIK